MDIIDRYKYAVVHGDERTRIILFEILQKEEKRLTGLIEEFKKYKEDHNFLLEELTIVKKALQLPWTLL